jgi:hypothetical protein
MKSSYEEIKKDFNGIRTKSGEKSILNRFGIDPCNTD